MRQLPFTPDRLWYYFEEILKVPRPSKHEDKIADWLMKFAADHSLEAKRDKVGNVLISKPASPGMENSTTVVLQSHMDMVCEKNSESDHDFSKDPIQARIDGDWVKATGTTLGADDGIGMAAQLAILDASNIQHGPLECLFTVDEETGLTGAFGLEPGFLKGRILLNLDSEDEGEVFIGCAGGRDTVVELPFTRITRPAHYDVALKINVSGLRGGHSGDDIHKGYGNANKLLNRVAVILLEKFGAGLAHFEAGNLRNAIAREGEALMVFRKEELEQVKDVVKQYESVVKAEYHVTEPALSVSVTPADLPESIIEQGDVLKLSLALYACPHGVIAYSQDIPGFVETSTNLAAVRTKADHFLITTSQRSSVASAKDDICKMVASVFRLAGCKVEHSDGYPGWTPNPDSAILGITVETYKALFGSEPKVLAIHAGLECGLIGEKYEGMDMISFGPTIKGAHSPDERLNIETVKKFWDLTLGVLARVATSGHS